MTHSVSIRHNFETAHRLPEIGGKCVSLHGHSWWCRIEVSADRIPDGTVVEFGAFKKHVRNWIDEHLDHGVMLGAADPLVTPLREQHCKVYAFGAEKLSRELLWPTVENVAVLLGRMAHQELRHLDAATGAQVTHVEVSETHVNSASWTPAARTGGGTP
ncbi:6-carboxytetrahydropterin synthase [Streptomyces sp. WAC06614]|uniref:6-pyruvoyl trahydropterin synthase family protein n=1 Tax=Streptomyces sp. WAC06614 TaxID=2487416 RepID=UPI000F7A204D|nr:6-carboxytetrahydropterin synthase [Streptomyces sp. WAC06614]RSS69855.1 6-carboxytetrahydropterin synthase [Streptomyces sp. WAC06614]